MIKNITIKGAVYNKVYRPFVNAQQRTQIFFGGSSSGKSRFLAQRVVQDLLAGGRNYLIVRNVHNTLKTSVYNEIVKVIQAWGLTREFNISGSSMTITCNNGYQAIFKGLDDVQKIKSITPIKGVITDIWVEEATETQYRDVKELSKRLRGISKRSKRVILSFNPIMRDHWIFKEWFAGRFGDDDTFYQDDNALILKTTYKDNAFLTDQDRYELENEKDKYYYNVYTLGNWGVLGNLIFTNWEIADLSCYSQRFERFYNGLDFGFTNDPTCMVRNAISHGEQAIYVMAGFYEYGLDNKVIAEKVLPIIGNEILRCDSAEPKSIYELRKYKVDAISAIKGKGSVNFGLQWLTRYKIIVERTLQGVINDLQLYQWQENRDGKVLNIPIDKNNHAPDAMRYSFSDAINQEPEKKTITKAKLGMK